MFLCESVKLSETRNLSVNPSFSALLSPLCSLDRVALLIAVTQRLMVNSRGYLISTNGAHAGNEHLMTRAAKDSRLPPSSPADSRGSCRSSSQGRDLEGRFCGIKRHKISINVCPCWKKHVELDPEHFVLEESDSYRLSVCIIDSRTLISPSTMKDDIFCRCLRSSLFSRAFSLRG